ncbi:partial Serine protease Do-like HtrA, partial [Methylococcales bacterium]
IEANPGLKSRFTEYVTFSNYTPEELVQILQNLARKEGFRFSPAALRGAISFLAREAERDGVNFGNARSAEKLYDKMKDRMSQRDPDSETFEIEDIPPFPGAEMRYSPGSARKPFNLVTCLPQATSQVYTLDDVKKVVGYVTVQMTDGQKGSGTGFVVSADGFFVTAYHVVEKASVIGVSFEKDARGTIAAELVGWDQEADMAVLHLAVGDYKWCELAPIGYTPELGEEVAALGFPLGEQIGREITFSPGSVSSIREKGSMIQITTPVTHGSSGGPLFRRSDYRVIGIIQGGIKPELGSSLNLAISIQELYLRLGAIG